VSSSEEESRQPLDISVSLHARVQAFFPVVEAVMGENIHPNQLPDLVITRGLDALLTDVLRGGQPDEDIVAKSLVAMSHENPDFVYEFFARTMHLGSGLGEWWLQLLGPQPDERPE
jgi:hypothetical protein